MVARGKCSFLAVDAAFCRKMKVKLGKPVSYDVLPENAGPGGWSNSKATSAIYATLRSVQCHRYCGSNDTVLISLWPGGNSFIECRCFSLQLLVVDFFMLK